MIVAKFGGTSVADADAIERLARIVRSRVAARPVVVVSALANVTDALLALAPLVQADDRAGVEAAVAALVDRHVAIARALPGGDAAIPYIAADADGLRRELGAALGRMLLPAELDAVAGRGELWSSRLVAAALEDAGTGASWVDIRALLVTDDRFGRATPQMQALTTRARECLRPLVEAGRVPVTQGFIGATADGRPTTLGRGGSDFTAALLGAALGVERVEIWTDVNGLMTADPRIVPSARTLAGGELRGGRGARHLRRQGPPSRHGPAAGAGGHPDRRPQLDPPRRPGHRHRALRRARAAGRLAGAIDQLEARASRSSTCGPRACSAPTASSGPCSRCSSATRWWSTSSRAAR